MSVIRVLSAPSSLKPRLTRRTFRDVRSTAGVNVAATLLASVGGIVLARQLGATDRGGLVTVLLWPAVAGSLASLGLTQATCYFLARRRSAGAAIMAAAARAALLTGVVVAIAGFIVAPLIGRTETVTVMMRLAFAFSPIFIAGGVWMSALQAVAIASWNRARIVQPVTYFVLVAGLAIVHRLTVTTATIAFCCALLLQGAYARVRAGMDVDGRESAPPDVLRTLYGYGVKVWAASVPQLINLRLDLLALSVMPAVAAADLGVYAVAVSLSLLALPASVAFGSVAFPKVAASTSEPAARRIERLSLLGAASTSALVLAPVCIVAPFAVPILFGSEFREAVGCLWLLAPGTVFLALNRVLADLLQGRGRPLSTAVAEGFGAALTVVLLLALTPRFGIRGAAFASSVAYCGAAVVLYWRLCAGRQAAVADNGSDLP